MLDNTNNLPTIVAQKPISVAAYTRHWQRKGNYEDCSFSQFVSDLTEKSFVTIEGTSTPEDAKKEAYVLCFANYKDVDGGKAPRRDGNVESSSCFVGDIDSSPPGTLARITALLTSKNTSHLAWHTARSTPDDERFKLIIPFAEPCDAQNHAAVWSYLSKVISDKLNVELDPSGKNLSRLVYGPVLAEFGVPVGHHQLVSHIGESIDIAALGIDLDDTLFVGAPYIPSEKDDEVDRSDELKGKAASLVADPNNTLLEMSLSFHVGNIGDTVKNAPEGKRDLSCFWAACELYRLGHTHAEALEFLLLANSESASPLEEHEIHAKVDNGFRPSTHEGEARGEHYKI